jgi:uncharacterized protein (TIGR03083 family)
VDEQSSAALLCGTIRSRTTEIVAALEAAGPSALEEPSSLPGWTRLTIACHLRYGASASRRMTIDARAGRPTSFYPAGRSLERPGTLVPGEGEEPTDVVRSLALAGDRLHDAWAPLSAAQWQTVIEEPAGNPDLGPVTVARLALLRLTEVEVHGTDLDLGLDDWSEVFVAHALPIRLGWLATRRSNHRRIESTIDGSWLLVPDDGPGTVVSVRGPQVTVEAAHATTVADAVIEGRSRDLLALLLGRPTAQDLKISGDVRLGRAFREAFPGP